MDEIIIDTSRCRYRYKLLGSDEYGCYAEAERGVCIKYCKEIPLKNCYYRQCKLNEQKLQAKEQECEELNTMLNNSETTYMALHKEYCLTCDNEDDLYEQVDKYKEVFKQIEEKCKLHCDACKEFEPEKQSEINCLHCQVTQFLNILNKIK